MPRPVRDGQVAGLARIGPGGEWPRAVRRGSAAALPGLAETPGRAPAQAAAGRAPRGCQGC